MKNGNKTSAAGNWKLLACLFLGAVSLTVAVVLLVIDPISIVARKYTRLSPGSFVMEFIKGGVDGVHQSLYIFNITNAEDFLSGKDRQLKVGEVGPFTYREVVHMDGLELDEEAGVMRYSPRVECVFVPEESIGRPEDFNVTVPNLALLGLTSVMSSYPHFVRLGYNFLVRQQKSKAIRTQDAKSFMWGTPEPLIKLGKIVAPGLIVYDRIGFFDHIYKVERKTDLVVGATEKDKFMIKTRNGHKKLLLSELHDAEKCEECDSFGDVYEGMMYPSPVGPDTRIKLFRSSFCKTAEMVYQRKRVLDNGVEGLEFHLNESFFSKGKMHGLLDLSECIHGFPIFLSKVYFLDVERQLYERIDGIRPDPNKFNTSYIVVEPLSGAEIETNATFQVNLLLGDLGFNPESRVFSNMLVPTAYCVIKQPELIEKISTVLKKLYVTLPLMLLSARIISFLVAFTLLAYSVLLYRSKWRKCSSNEVKSCQILTKIDEKSPGVKVQEPLINKLDYQLY